MIDIINETDISEVTKEDFCLMDRPNFSIQNELICGADNFFSIKYYVSLCMDAEMNSDALWVDKTEEFFGAAAVTCNNETVRSMMCKSGCSFCRLKVVLTPTVTGADNSARIMISYR